MKKTGQPREQFQVSKWAKNINGKSVPVEYIGPDASYVDIDFAHSKALDKNGNWATGPDSPHIGWSTGKSNKTTGHILLDSVPTGRDATYSDQEIAVVDALKKPWIVVIKR